MSSQLEMYLVLVTLSFTAILGLITKFKQSTKFKEVTTVANLQWTWIRIPLINELITVAKFRKCGVALIDQIAKETGSKIVKFIYGYKSVYFVSDRDVIQTLLKSSLPGHLHRLKEWYDVAFPGHMKDGLILSPVEIWSPHRKASAPAFSYKSLGFYCNYANSCAREMVQMVMNMERDVEQKEFGPILEEFTVQLIIQIMMGKDQWSTFSKEERQSYYQSFRTSKEIMMERFLNPILFFPPIWFFHPKKIVLENALAMEAKLSNEAHCYKLMKLNAHTRNELVIRRYQKVGNSAPQLETKSYGSIVEHLLASGMSDKEIVSEIGTFIVAGYDTARVSIDMLLFHLASHPDYQKRCQQEVDQMFEARPLLGNSTSTEDFPMEELSQLKYLEQCIHESLRLTPTVPIFGRLLQQPLQVSPNLKFSPGDSIIVVCWAVHRDPDNYPNPDVYDPDRFLSENVKSRHPGTFLPFSLGLRNCIGWKLALLQIKIFTAWILRYYDLSTSDRAEDVKIMFDITIRPERPYNVVLNRRKV